MTLLPRQKPRNFLNPDSHKKPGLVVGIDASNLRLGGGVTHLSELLSAANPQEVGIYEVVVWGWHSTLLALPNRPWLRPIFVDRLNRGLFSRVWWQIFSLASEARKEGCDALFVPGGSYVGTFSPVITMSQNLLPFEWSEIKRAGFSVVAFKMLALRIVQTWSFRRSTGIIFLTNYAKNAVINVTGSLKAKTKIIPHGISKRFSNKKIRARDISQYSEVNPFQLLYVSNIDIYKHQLPVLRAVNYLRSKGYPLHIKFIGPGTAPSIERLNQEIAILDSQGLWANYLGQLPYGDLQAHYAGADLGIFASSCETFGIILLEKMATGMPLVCSRLSSMNEVLKSGGLYFHPEKENEIANAIEEYLLSPKLQEEKRGISYQLSQLYSWEKCANETFSFLSSMALGSEKVLDHKVLKG